MEDQIRAQAAEWTGDVNEPPKTKNIIVLVSGGGTNLQALIDAQMRGDLGCGRITCVISSRPDAYALVRAKNAGIPTRVLRRKDFDSTEAYSAAMLEAFYEEYADLIVQAGFMTILDAKVCRAYPNKIINVHPALIPSFCGKGFYGLHVHEAALAKGVKITGATVHFVNEVCDGGPIISQKAVAVEPGDTPETLQRRVMEQAEWHLLPEAVRLFCEGRLTVKDNIVSVSE
jgi:phosphoribosylglycinamide formyltransferase-1